MTLSHPREGPALGSQGDRSALTGDQEGLACILFWAGSDGQWRRTERDTDALRKWQSHVEHAGTCVQAGLSKTWQRRGVDKSAAAGAAGPVRRARAVGRHEV